MNEKIGRDFYVHHTSNVKPMIYVGCWSNYKIIIKILNEKYQT